MASKQNTVSTSASESKRHEYDFTYTQNRELSWLQFDHRVLEEARDGSVPLLERLKMAAIFESNLDEFVMIRMGSLGELASLKRQPIDNKSNQTPIQQLSAIYDSLPTLIAQHDETVAELEDKLADVGIVRVDWKDYTPEDLTAAENFFDDMVLPVASPQIIDPRHPFPNLRNDALYCVYNLASSQEAGLLGMIEVPPTLPRIVELSKSVRPFRYTLLEDVILACGAEVFGEFHTSQRAVIRVTRNADIDPDEGAFDVEDDYRQHIKKILKKRLRLNPVRLEVQGTFGKALIKRMRKALGLTEPQVFSVNCPMRMGEYAFSLEGKVSPALASELTYPPFSPQPPASVNPDRPMHEQIEEHDILLYYPYESMEPFLRLLHESAQDPDVMQIKITLYRVAKKSRLCESLIAAAENGVDVTVVMELRARFDEENNIEWAERLGDAGCTVLYGSAGFKVHSKICQITRRVNGEVVRITQLGTGNYNEKTAGLYADYSYMTADPRIGEDASRFFRNMQIGNLNGDYAHLGVAPVGLKPLIMRGLNREIAKARAGEEAYVCFKMNSLTDREVIDKLSEASCAGVKVDLIIRGISCLLPGVPGKTENISVRCIVGRMLEHARVYMFGTERDTIYLSSADMMTRNTEHRVEIAFPLLEPETRAEVAEDIRIQLADNVKARILLPDGTYTRVSVEPGEPLVDAQLYFMKRAVKAADELGSRLAKEERRARRHPIPTGENNNGPQAKVEDDIATETVLVTEPTKASTDTTIPAYSPTTVVNSAKSAPSISPSALENSVETPAIDSKDAGSTASPDNSREAVTEKTAPEPEVQPETEPESSVETKSSGDAPAISPDIPDRAETVEVEATTLPAPREAIAEKPDLDHALALMIEQNGRGATGWALIKAGFAVLCGRSTHTHQ